MKWTPAALIALLIFSIGCTAASPTPSTVRPSVPRTRTTTPVPPDDQAALRQLINAECEAVVQQDIDRLQGMWASDGVVTDANHTPDNPSDDVTWKGWDAIRDRYVNIVFPSNPTFCEHPDTQVTVSGDTGTAVSGTKIGTTNTPNSTKWTFKKGGDGWKITSLVYNNTTQK